MSDRDELVEPWYVKEIKSLQERLSTKLRPAEHSALCTAIAALSAQPQGEPVAWQQRYIDPEEGPSIWQHADEATAKCLKDRADYELRPLYTAPPSGVREGMLRAVKEVPRDILEMSVTHPDYDSHYDAYRLGWNSCAKVTRKAITRAAEQVNAEQTHVRVPVAVTDEMREVAETWARTRPHIYVQELWDAMLRAATGKESEHGK